MDPQQRQAAERQIIALLVCLGFAFVLHLAGIGSTLINVVRELADPNGIFTLFDGAGLSDEEIGERVGRVIGFSMAAIYSALGLIWIPLGAFGVYRRKPWGRISTLVYFATTIPTCCCTLFGIYGLYALLRSDVKALFDERRS